jgi:hypothetical protein
MGTGYHSPGSGNPRLSGEERKPPLRERSEAHLLVRKVAHEVAEEYHENAPGDETAPNGELIQTVLRGWGTPLREGAVGGPPSSERSEGSSEANSGGVGSVGVVSTVPVGSIGRAGSSGAEVAADSEEPAVGTVALADREGSEVLDEQISDLPGLGVGRLDALHEAGYRTPADVLQATTEELMDVDSIGESVAERVQETINEEYDRPEHKTDYGLGLGKGTTPEDLPEWGQRFTDNVSDDVADAIGQLDYEIMTHQGPDSSLRWLDSSELEEIDDDPKQQAIEYVETLYQSSAAKMAAHAHDDDTAQRIFENIVRGSCRIPQSDNAVPSHHQTDAGSHLQIPSNSIEMDLMHELGHATTYSHGYDIHQQGRESLDEYRDRASETNTDPYVHVDPDDPDYLLSQEHGEQIEGVPEEFETLIDRTNEAFQRIHRAADREDQHGQYLAGLNYSGLSATEFFGVFHSYMQADVRTANEHPTQDRQEFEADIAEMLFYQPEVSKAYFEVFEPADLPAEIVADFRADPLMDTPYDEYELPSERE